MIKSKTGEKVSAKVKATEGLVDAIEAVTVESVVGEAAADMTDKEKAAVADQLAKAKERCTRSMKKLLGAGAKEAA